MGLRSPPISPSQASLLSYPILGLSWQIGAEDAQVPRRTVLAPCHSRAHHAISSQSPCRLLPKTAQAPRSPRIFSLLPTNLIERPSASSQSACTVLLSLTSLGPSRSSSSSSSSSLFLSLLAFAPSRRRRRCSCVVDWFVAPALRFASRPLL